MKRNLNIQKLCFSAFNYSTFCFVLSQPYYKCFVDFDIVLPSIMMASWQMLLGCGNLKTCFFCATGEKNFSRCVGKTTFNALLSQDILPKNCGLTPFAAELSTNAPGISVAMVTSWMFPSLPNTDCGKGKAERGGHFSGDSFLSITGLTFFTVMAAAIGGV